MDNLLERTNPLGERKGLFSEPDCSCHVTFVALGAVASAFATKIEPTKRWNEQIIQVAVAEWSNQQVK